MTDGERDLVELSKRLRTALDRRGWAERDIADRSGVAKGTIGNLLAGRNLSKKNDPNWRPRADNVRKVALALGENPIEWLALAGHQVDHESMQEAILQRLNSGIAQLEPEEQRFLERMVHGILVSRGYVHPSQEVEGEPARIEVHSYGEPGVVGIRSGPAEIAEEPEPDRTGRSR